MRALVIPLMQQRQSTKTRGTATRLACHWPEGQVADATLVTKLFALAGMSDDRREACLHCDFRVCFVCVCDN